LSEDSYNENHSCDDEELVISAYASHQKPIEDLIETIAEIDAVY